MTLPSALSLIFECITLYLLVAIWFGWNKRPK
jgi:hypothetical protein